MARFFVWLISMTGGIALVEVTLTISLAYLSFLVAEHYLHVSVMATVTAALVMGSLGRTGMSGSGWHLLSETWENLGFWANSLIFVLVGMAVPEILSVFSGSMWFTLLVLLAVAFFARGLLTHAVLPVLSRTGVAADVSLSFRTVMWWGGLRGAVSLALALAVFENDAFDEDVRNFIAALVCAFVLFTLSSTPRLWAGHESLRAGQAVTRRHGDPEPAPSPGHWMISVLPCIELQKTGVSRQMSPTRWQMPIRGGSSRSAGNSVMLANWRQGLAEDQPDGDHQVRSGRGTWISTPVATSAARSPANSSA